MSMCAPLVDPCCASYIEVFTRTSSNCFRSGCGQRLADGQIGRCRGLNHPDARAASPSLRPVLLTIRAEATWLVLLPLKMLLASTPFNRKLLLVSRWPLAQIGWLPKPALAPLPLGSSALTPGERMASPVKLPVGKGMDLDFRFLQDVSVCGIDGIHQRRLFLHRNRRADLPDLQRHVDGGGAISLALESRERYPLGIHYE